MAGSGHLETFRLLRFLRSRNCADGQSSYGIQMAVSSANYCVIIPLENANNYFINVFCLLHRLNLHG